MEFLYFLLKENEFAQSCLILCNLSDVQLFATPWTVACKAPLSMGFSRQEYRSGLPFSTPGDFSDPGIEPAPLASPALAGRFFTTVPPGRPHRKMKCVSNVSPWTQGMTFLAYSTVIIDVTIFVPSQ